MVQLNNFALVSIFFAVICGAVLIYVGVKGIRTGRIAQERALSAGQPVVWHQQPSILFGINNFVFSLLVLLVVSLSLFVDRTVKYVLIALIVLTLLVSVALVVRCVSAAMQTVKNLRKR